MKRPATVVIALIAISCVPHVVLAACNALPGAVQAGDGSGGGGPPMYKVALGSISQTHLLPGVSASVVIKADDTCVGDEDRRLTFERPKTDAYVVALLNAREGTTAVTYPIVVTSSTARCDAIRATMTERFGTKWACNASGTVVPAIASDLSSLRFSLAQLPAGLSATADPVQRNGSIALGSGPMKLFATNDDAAVARIAMALVNGNCADLCVPLSQGGAFACADRFYQVASSGAFQLSTIACDLAQLPNSLKTTKFREQCADKSGNPLDFPKCQSSATPHKADIYVDACGNLKIPLDFADLLDTAKQVDKRVLSGKSAMSRFKEGGPSDTDRMWIPGREFIGSTPYNDAFGGFSSWQLPKMSVFYDDGSQAFGIRGLVDKTDAHIVHVVPRRPVTWLCDVGAGADPEACEKIEEEFGVVKTLCACADARTADCKCQPELPADQAVYFACKGGTFDGMPCTRSAHCNPGGTCTRQPKCQKKKAAVFSENSPDGGTTPCWQDKTCTAADEQCGYDLFDFRNRVDANNVYTLDSKIKKNVDPNRRGVCKGSIGTVCNNQNEDTKCTAADDACVGYALTAEGQP